MERRCSAVSIAVVLGAVAATLMVTPRVRAQQAKQPVYVGARVCATCHEGKTAGNQYSHWLMSKHARAYAALSLPEARRMAQLSGIPDQPEKAPVCLGCHATAADAEPWEKDPTFALEDGLQCEKCHGPGSEYMAEKVMKDPEAARKAGLRKFTKKDCVLCHYVKGSHVAVHKLPQLDIDKAWDLLAHPVPKDSHVEKAKATAPPGPPPGGKGPKYVGVGGCERCHRGPDMGHQASLWRLSPHANAYAVLSTPAALEIAKKDEVTGDPQTAPVCLKCHSTAGRDPAGGAEASFSPMEGVGCEACHGPGSDYRSEAVMRDRKAAMAAGLKSVTEKTCRECHTSTAARPFDYATALAKIAHPTHPPTKAAASRAPAKSTAGVGSVHGGPVDPDPRPPRADIGLGLDVVYKTPLNLAFRPDGREIWVACEASGTVIVVDALKRLKVAEIASGDQPADVTFSPDGSRAYVSNRLDDTVSVIDTATRKVTSKVRVGGEPHGLLTDASGKTLYVLNTTSEDISVIDTTTLEEIKRLKASRNPWSLALSPDGKRIAVTNALSRLVKFRESSLSEVTIIDTEKASVVHRAVAPEANLLLGIAWHPSGEFAFFTLNRTKNLVPMTRILQGWTITNGIGVLWKDGRVDQVLLDEPQHYFADIYDVAFSRDGRYAFATSSSTNRLAVVDVGKLVRLLRSATDDERASVVPNHLGKSAEFVVARLATMDSPRGVTVSPDGRTAFVANSLDDTLTVIDVATLRVAGQVDLGGPKTITRVRWGEKLFNNANITFQGQFSCHTCHPDGHVDGLTYDIEADGIGVSPVDNRTLRGIYDTDPFKWEGTNPSLARQCGARLAVFFTRVDPFTKEELQAVNDYTVTIPRPPNRNRPLGEPLTEAQRRGKVLFERSRTNDGREIPLDNRCLTCHFPPYYTDRSQRDVGTKYTYDRQGKFDVPGLLDIYDSAPYLHNGMADTLEEIWTRFNPYDRHGVTNDMTKDQLNDLIEYLKTL
jgi:YVTN family beta-propeller protein